MAAAAEPRAVAPISRRPCAALIRPMAVRPRGWTRDALPWARSSAHVQEWPEALPISQKARRTSINPNQSTDNKFTFVSNAITQNCCPSLETQ